MRGFGAVPEDRLSVLMTLSICLELELLAALLGKELYNY